MPIKDKGLQMKAIRARFGSFELRVLCIGLTYASDVFTRLISSLLQEMKGNISVLFLDSVCIYSKSIENHRIHLRKLFQALREHKKYTERVECHIGDSEVNLIGIPKK